MLLPARTGELRLAFRSMRGGSDESVLAYDADGEEEEEDYNEILCMRDVPDASVLANVMRATKSNMLLWVEKVNLRQLGLYTLLWALQLLGAAGSGYLLLSLLCGENGECFLFSWPVLGAGGLLLLLWGCSYLSSSSFLQSRVSGVENGMAFLIVRRARGSSFELDTSLRAKVYRQAMECPITLLRCSWRDVGPTHSSSLIRLACYALPQEEALHVPVSCDAIDTLREGPLRIMPFKNHLGVLVVHRWRLERPQEERFVRFLFKSGFSVVCNAQEASLIVAIKRIAGSGQWVAKQVAVQEQEVLITLFFEP
jgi:hypothetical protein